MDKKLALFLVLATAVWIGWMVVQQTLMQPVPRKAGPQAPQPAEPKAEAAGKPAGEARKPVEEKKAAPEPEVKAKPEPAKPTPAKPAEAKPGEPKPARAAAAAEPAVKEATLELGLTDPAQYKVHVVLTTRGAAVRRITLNRYESEDRKSKLTLVGDEAGVDSLLLTLKDDPKAAEKLPDLAARIWEIVQPATPERVEFRTKIPELGLEFVKRYTLKPEMDGLDLAIEITNIGDADRTVTYELTTAHGLPLEGKWYARSYRSVVFGGLTEAHGVKHQTQAAKDVAVATKKETIEAWTELPVRFAGVETQYFCSLLVPRHDEPQKKPERWIAEAKPYLVDAGPEPVEHPDGADVSLRLTSAAKELKPRESLKHEYFLFGGPKKLEVLSQYQDYNLDAALDYGSFLGIPIGLVSRIMVAILGFFYSLFHNYGLAIMGLTVAVRVAMFPLSRKQALSAMRMQKLQPELQKLREKYKNDKEKLGAATMEFYRKNGVNPLSGCLPVLVQMPIFIGLYWGLAQSVDLRLARFLYVDNLAAPDMLFHWGHGLPLISSLLGPWFNLLPIVTVALMIVQQKMYTPPAADPQTEATQKMMPYMMAVFGYMFYTVPSGLCVYFIASSLWGLAERQLLPKFQHAPGGPPAAAAPETRRPLARTKR